MSRQSGVTVTVNIGWPEPALAADWLQSFVQAVLWAEGRREGQIDVSIVGDAEAAGVNWEHLGHAGPTDVISFDFAECGSRAGVVDGEVIVNGEWACREAARRRVPARQELLRYIVHGLLHVAGWEDGTRRERARMWSRQEALLRLPPIWGS